MVDGVNLEHSNALQFAQSVVTSAASGMFWAWFASRRMIKSMVVLAVAQLMSNTLLNRVFTPVNKSLTVAEWQHGDLSHNLFGVVFIVVGYLLFAAFIRTEGRRFFAAHTEIELASAIQRDLVRPISLSTDAFEFYGKSLPSGVVGGDLLDVVPTEQAVCAYVADVAGHGVPAGVLMSMVKSAVRMRLTSADSGCDGLLGKLNEVLTPLSGPHSYVTFAYVMITHESLLKYSLAGHLPLFHFVRQTGKVERCSVENFPVAMFPAVTFETATMECDAGDLIAIITDGLTEIFDGKGRELGSDYIERTLCELAERPLPDIADRIFKAAEAFGKVADDRTLLLLRHV